MSSWNFFKLLISSVRKTQHRSSLEKRAMETAEVLASGLDLKIEIIPELREWGWGEWSNRAWADIKRDLEAMDLEKRYLFLPPGGESWKQVEERGRKALVQITSSDYRNVIIVAHGGALRILMPVLTDSPIETSFQYDFENCSITIFDWDGRKFREVRVNDISHL